MTSEEIVIYDETTGEVVVMKIGEYWVLPANLCVFSGTQEEAERHISYTEEGNAIFMIEDSNAS